jgi:hypothetical protein
MTVLDFRHWSFSGPTGRRCGTCFLPVPEGYSPAERLDGSLLLECPACNDRRVEERERVFRIKSGKATPEDHCTSVSELWRLRVEAE